MRFQTNDQTWLRIQDYFRFLWARINKIWTWRKKWYYEFQMSSQKLIIHFSLSFLSTFKSVIFPRFFKKRWECRRCTCLSSTVYTGGQILRKYISWIQNLFPSKAREVWQISPHIFMFFEQTYLTLSPKKCEIYAWANVS